MTANNPYVPFPSKIKEIIKHTEKEWTFRMEYVGDVKPGQFYEVSVPKYGEAPISVSGIGEDFVDLTIRRVGRVTDEVFKLNASDTILLRGPYGNGFDTSLYANGEVIVVAGANKLVAGGAAQAIARIKAVACPLNARRLGLNTPCSLLGKCDPVNCEKGMCNVTSIIDKPVGGHKITIVLVDEEAGY